jgi:hypothetical protein
MPKRELRTTELWCADCDTIFTGEAWVTVHTVEEPGGQDRVTFYRAASPCPTNPNHKRIGDPGERPGG